MLSIRTTQAARFFILLFGQIISSTAVDGFCSTLSRQLDLIDECTISDDCSKITCKMDFVDKPITFKLTVNKCKDPVSITASMDVPDLFITWSHTYTSDDIVEVPGFTTSLASFASAGVYVQVGLTPKGDELRLTVKLLVGGELLGQSVYPVKLIVMEGDLPIDTNDCGTFSWWDDMPVVGQAAIIGGTLILIIVMIVCCYCCCCKSDPANNQQGFIVVRRPMAAGPSVITPSSNVIFPM